MQYIDSVISQWKVWGNMPERFSRAKMTWSQVPYTLVSRVSSWMHSGEPKNLTCLSISFTRTSTGNSASRGDHSTQSWCYIISMMFSFLGFLSHRLMLFLARRAGYIGLFFFFGCTPGQREMHMNPVRLTLTYLPRDVLRPYSLYCEWHVRKIYVVI